MRYPAPVFALTVAQLLGCSEPWPDPPATERDALLAEHEEWRSARETNMITPPGGPVLWVGLWDIPQGASSFGSDEASAIVLPPEDAPPFAGTLRRAGQVVTLEPAPDAPILLRREDPADPEAVVEVRVAEPLVLENDRSGNTTVLGLGSLGLRVHSEPGTDRLWLRAWDEDSPQREIFRLPAYFPIDDRWRVTARFEEYAEPEVLRFPDVTGGEVEYRATGTLNFRLNDENHSLIATAGETSSSFFVLLWDSTATVNTYQGGRYLRVPFPDDNGWTTVDFNRTYNAPCVFTAHSVCALPPRDNWLTLHLTAGEQRPVVPYY